MSNRACLFATTKYQMLNAMNIALKIGFDSDLYIIDEIYDDTKEIAEKVRSTTIFNNVFIVDFNKLTRITNNPKINHLYAYVRYKNIADCVIENRNYSVMYFCTGSIIEEVVRWRLIAQGTKFFFYDEGVATYLGIMERVSFTDKIFRFLLIGKKALQNEFDKVLYEPDFYIGNDHSHEINPLPKFQKDSWLGNTLNMVFGYRKEFDIPQKVVLFDFLVEKNLNNEGIELYNNLIKRISDIFKDELIIKPHPSDKKRRYENILIYTKTSIPFEIVNLNCDFNNKILIAFFSTAVLTPKFLFDEEPTVVVLYKVFRQYMKRSISEELDRFFLKIKENYPEKRFFLPISYEECLITMERIHEVGNTL